MHLARDGDADGSLGTARGRCRAASPQKPAVRIYTVSPYRNSLGRQGGAVTTMLFERLFTGTGCSLLPRKRLPLLAGS